MRRFDRAVSQQQQQNGTTPRPPTKPFPPALLASAAAAATADTAHSNPVASSNYFLSAPPRTTTIAASASPPPAPPRSPPPPLLPLPGSSHLAVNGPLLDQKGGPVAMARKVAAASDVESDCIAGSAPSSSAAAAESPVPPAPSIAVAASTTGRATGVRAPRQAPPDPDINSRLQQGAVQRSRKECLSEFGSSKVEVLAATAGRSSSKTTTQQERDIPSADSRKRRRV